MFYAARTAFGYSHPNFDPKALAEIRVIAKIQNRWIKVASAFPVSPVPHNKRGIDGTDWIKIDAATSAACLDPRDYRPKPKIP